MYVQGFVIPVVTDGRQAYLDLATRAAPVFAEHGAARSVECWGDEVMHGAATDFHRAVQATDGETVVFSWICWPDQATCDAAKEPIFADARMDFEGPMPFDGKRMIFAGFETVFDTGDSGPPGYVDGMVASAPGGAREDLVAHAERMAKLFLEQGARRLVEGWGADIQSGKVTDFRRAVQAKDDEAIVFSWIEWPDKATRDAGMGALMQDPRMRETPPVWNARLAIFGGFTPILDTARQ